MSPRVASQRRRLAVRLATAALVWSTGLVLAAVLVPVYDSNTSNGQGLWMTRVTLVQENGAGVLAVVAIPMIVSIVVGAAMLVRHRQAAPWAGRVAWTAIAGLVAVAILGILSIGGFMLPVAILLAIAVRLAPAAGAAADNAPGLAAEA